MTKLSTLSITLQMLQMLICWTDDFFPLCEMRRSKLNFSTPKEIHDYIIVCAFSKLTINMSKNELFLVQSMHKVTKSLERFAEFCFKKMSQSGLSL